MGISLETFTQVSWTRPMLYTSGSCLSSKLFSGVSGVGLNTRDKRSLLISGTHSQRLSSKIQHRHQRLDRCGPQQGHRQASRTELTTKHMEALMTHLATGNSMESRITH